jgi:hypothetical protein
VRTGRVCSATCRCCSRKDVVAQALLGKMLTMLDQHENVVSRDKGMSDEHVALLDGM